jgi:CRP-like cAMP-binding protein
LPSTPFAGSPSARPKNQLLRALPAADFERLRPHLKTVSTRTKQVFYKQGEALGYVYFPNGGVLSITTLLSDGTMVETATVGNEGMVGIEAFFNADPIAPGMTMMQVPDTNVERLSVSAFREELARGKVLSILIGRYAQTTLKQMMQSSACNALHHVTERCPRGLLMTHDRVEGDTFQLSQEFLAVMLGVRRQSVSVVASTLQKAGLITYRHGRVTVLDRAGLEAASCECYAAIRSYSDAQRARLGSR